jgi:hypothetical protein
MTDHNLEAERAAPGITDAEIAGIMGWRGPGVYSGPTLRKIRRVLEEDRARRAPALGEDGLPPLPEPDADLLGDGQYLAWGEKRVRQAQRDAVAADRAARQNHKEITS